MDWDNFGVRVANIVMANSAKPKHMGRYARRGLVLCCVVLGLAACKPADPPPVLNINSTPQDGVAVTITNGQQESSVGVTPMRYESVPNDRVLVEVQDDSFKISRELVDMPTTGEKTVTLNVTPRLGKVTFETDPPFAEVEVEGFGVLGKTPLRNSDFPVGTHNFTLTLENHETITDAITVEEDRVYTRSHILTPLPATIRVTAKPVGANIYLNDVPQTRSAPASFDVRPGMYRVLVHAEGYLSSEQAIDLEPTEVRALEFSLVEGDAPPNMVLVPAGEFVLGVQNGAPDEQPQQKVFLEAYYIDRYEVTNRQYKRVYPEHEIEEGKEDFPVTGISFNQAEAYAKAVGKRLPTELEWEKAARGTEGFQYPWGNNWQDGRCNNADAEDPGLQPVGSFREGVSPLGCFDMAGNAAEWTSSWYNPYPGNEDISIEYGQVYKVLRGGSYLSDKFDVRAPRRTFAAKDTAKPAYGMRLVVDVVRVEGVIKPASAVAVPGEES